jgi:hypothetical protein
VPPPPPPPDREGEN